MDSNNGAHHRVAYQRSQSLQQQPSTSSSHQYPTSAARIQQKQFYLNNYTSIPNNNNNINSNQITPKPNISTKMLRLNSTPASATITSSSSEQHKLQKQSLAPLDFPIQISYNIDGSNATDSPTVKIDYSKMELPATSPSIKIDLSHFNAQIAPTASNNSNASHQPSSNATSTIMPASTAGLDEDYDA